MKRFCSVFLALILLWSLALPVFAAKDAIYDLTLDSQGVYVFNPETGTAIYEKAENSRMFPASTTKIMTALVVLESCSDPKNTAVTVPDTSLFSYIVEEKGVNMQLTQGETFTVYDLLMGLMVSSFCDAADLLAISVSGSVPAFVERMNEKAASMKLENTHFENTHGLHNPNHYSSPKDIALILWEAAQIPLFREILSTREYTLPATGSHPNRALKHTVDIFRSGNPYFLSSYVGGKSGFTDQAGRCLAAWSEEDGVSYISVLLGANMEVGKHYSGNMAFQETHLLTSYAYENFEIQTLFDKGEEVAKLPVTNSETVLPVITGEEVRFLARKDQTPEYRFALPASLEAKSVSADTPVGELILTFNEEDSESRSPLFLQWDGTPVTTKSFLEKGAENAAEAVSGIFRTDKSFLILLILLIVMVAICIPAMLLTQHLHKKKSHIPKH